MALAFRCSAGDATTCCRFDGLPRNRLLAGGEHDPYGFERQKSSGITQSRDTILYGDAGEKGICHFNEPEKGLVAEWTSPEWSPIKPGHMQKRGV